MKCWHFLSICGHFNTPPTLTSPTGNYLDSALGCGCPAHSGPSGLWLVCLVLAVLGSRLTLSPFQPGLGDHVFLGRKAGRSIRSY